MVRLLARRLIALSAAYALALTVLLPFLALATLPAGAGSQTLAAICRGQQSGPADDSGQPIRHGPVCLCGGACTMATCCGGGADMPRTVAAIDPAILVSVVRIPDRRPEAVSSLERRRPQAARAPPA